MKGCYYSAKTRHKESESERRLSVTKQCHVQREGNESVRDSDRTGAGEEGGCSYE